MKTYKRPCDCCGRMVEISANKDPDSPCFCKYCHKDFQTLPPRAMAAEDEY